MKQMCLQMVSSCCLLSALAEGQWDEWRQSTFVRLSSLLEYLSMRQTTVSTQSDAIAAKAQTSHFHLIKTGARSSGTCWFVVICKHSHWALIWQQPGTSHTTHKHTNTHPHTLILQRNVNDETLRSGRGRSMATVRVHYPAVSAINPPPFIHRSQICLHQSSHHLEAPSPAMWWNLGVAGSDLWPPLTSGGSSGVTEGQRYWWEWQF